MGVVPEGGTMAFFRLNSSFFFPGKSQGLMVKLGS
jgi:hypothetical protein